MPQLRHLLMHTLTTAYYQYISCCARRAFFCGFDKVSRKSFDQRKKWLLDRIKVRSSAFAIDAGFLEGLCWDSHLLKRRKSTNWLNSFVYIQFTRAQNGQDGEQV